MSKTDNRTGCYHYGAKPLSYCYCGAMVSRAEWERKEAEKLAIKYDLSRGWRVVRDESGMPTRMEWQS